MRLELREYMQDVAVWARMFVFLCKKRERDKSEFK